MDRLLAPGKIARFGRRPTIASWQILELIRLCDRAQAAAPRGLAGALQPAHPAARPRVLRVRAALPDSHHRLQPARRRAAHAAASAEPPPPRRPARASTTTGCTRAATGPSACSSWSSACKAIAAGGGHEPGRARLRLARSARPVVDSILVGPAPWSTSTRRSTHAPRTLSPGALAAHRRRPPGATSARTRRTRGDGDAAPRGCAIPISPRPSPTSPSTATPGSARVLDDEGLAALRERADDLMLGRVTYPGLFFQLRRAPRGRYEDAPLGRAAQGPVARLPQDREAGEGSALPRLDREPALRAHRARRSSPATIAIYRAVLFNKGQRAAAATCPGTRTAASSGA